jgi:hypothetical protein
MRYSKSVIALLILFLSATYSVIVNSKVSFDPQFYNFEVKVKNGPYAKNILLNSEQEKFSTKWKRAMQEQLDKPVNFSGHYRLHTAFGGQGMECMKDNWVCGWVIDKLTGKVVSELPKDDNGSNIYVDVGDNGTPMGLPFEIDAYKDSTMLVITGQAIPATSDATDSPICKSVIFNFEGNKFVKIVESIDGCKRDN